MREAIRTYFTGITQLKQIRTIKLLIRKNGIAWTILFLTNCLARLLFKWNVLMLVRSMRRLEEKYGLPGINDKEINQEIWQNWNWSQEGEEWTVSEGWKRSLIDDVLLKYIGRDKAVLEIGPGSGRWTETLQKISKDLTCVDIADKCIEICRKRFSNSPNIHFFVNDGSSLGFIGDGAIDFIWSFDVFVHITPSDTDKYIMEFYRVLKDGGRGVIHHAKEGGLHGGNRSRMTAELFRELLKKHGLKVIDQFDSWGDAGQFNVHRYHDTITVFEK